MSDNLKPNGLRKEIAELRQRLDEAEQTLSAIRSGEVDALVVNTKLGEQVFTLQGADTVYRVAIESIDEGAITLSPEGTILYSNHYFAKMLRIDLNKVIGTSIFDSIATENPVPLAALLAQDSGRVEMSLRAADGSQVPVYVATKKLQLDNPTICAVVTDLTEQKKSEEVMALKERLTADLTALRKADQALKESEERFRSVLESSRDVIVRYDLKANRCEYVSPSCEALVGYSPAEFANMDDKTALAAVHPDDLPSLLAAQASSLESGVSGAEYRQRHKDGRYIWVSNRMLVIKDMSGNPSFRTSNIRDITERKRAEEATRESEERFRALANNIPQLAWMADGTGWISWYNQRWYDYTGTNLEEMKGWGWQKVHHPDYVQPVTEKFKQHVAIGEAWEDTFPLRGVDGNYRWFLSRAFPIRDTQGKVIRWFGTNTDITEKLKAEEDLKRYTTELEVAYKELEAFSYSISHDLRAPLRTLDGFSEMVLEDYGDRLDESGKDYLNRIRNASHNMSELIDAILKLTRISRAEIHQDEVDLSDLAKSIMEVLKQSQLERQAEFIVEPGLIVKGDMALLRVVLNNLLENAWKYTSKCPLTRIEIGSVNQNGKKVFFIKDNGVGFDMRYKDKLFHPFQRLHAGNEYQGTGIGLATVQRVIRRHNGRIWAESEVGNGTTFYFTLE